MFLVHSELKNVNTGLDLTVPSYEDASAPKKVKFYHVVVISRLVHFKQGEHSPEDVVQFMVFRIYLTRSRDIRWYYAPGTEKIRGF